MDEEGLIYCAYEGRPTIYEEGSGGIAWSFIDGQWRKAPGPDVYTKAEMMSKKTFTRRFGELPPPPMPSAIHE